MSVEEESKPGLKDKLFSNARKMRALLGVTAAVASSAAVVGERASQDTERVPGNSIEVRLPNRDSQTNPTEAGDPVSLAVQELRNQETFKGTAFETAQAREPAANPLPGPDQREVMGYEWRNVDGKDVPYSNETGEPLKIEEAPEKNQET